MTQTIIPDTLAGFRLPLTLTCTPRVVGQRPRLFVVTPAFSTKFAMAQVSRLSRRVRSGSHLACVDPKHRGEFVSKRSARRSHRPRDSPALAMPPFVRRLWHRQGSK